MKIFRLISQAVYITLWRFAHQGLGTSAKWLVTQVAQRIFGTPVLKHSRVTPHLYVGGRLAALGWQRLRAAGVGAIVNLRQEAPTEKPGVAPDAYLCLPTPDDHAPTLEHLEQGCAFIADAIREGRGVYVHCASGVGRAPTMAAAYLVTTGIKPDKALAAIRQVRPFINPTRAQIEQLARFAERQSANGD